MKKKIFACFTVVLLVLMLLASCAASDKSFYAETSSPKPGNMAADMAAPESKYAYGYDNNYVSERVEYEMPAEKNDGGFFDSGANNGNYSEKIIKNVSVNAQTKEYEKAVESILAAVKQHGGYEQSVSSTGRGYNSSDYYTRTARMTLRIPSENLDKFLNEVGNLINVTSQSSSQSNVTAQYYDTKARIEVLEAEREAYEEMLKEAKNVSELLEIRDRLYKTIEEIEANQTQLDIYDNKVAYSTVTIVVDEVKEYVEVETPKTSFGDRIGNAFKGGWQSFAEGFQNLAVGLVYSIPSILLFVVFIGGAAVIIIIAVKRAIKKHKKGKSDAE